jgi:hypothetical protein
MLGAAMAVLLVVGGLIGLAVALGPISAGFAFGAGAGCAGSLLAARLRRHAASAEGDRHRAAVG